jgi:hypothetical protein
MIQRPLRRGPGPIQNGNPITRARHRARPRANAGRITIPIVIRVAAVRPEQARDHHRQDDPGQSEHDVDDPINSVDGPCVAREQPEQAPPTNAIETAMMPT